MISFFTHRHYQIAQSVSDVTPGEHVHLISADRVHYPAIIRRAYNRVNFDTHGVEPTVIASVWYGDDWHTVVIGLDIVVKRGWKFSQQ